MLGIATDAALILGMARTHHMENITNPTSMPKEALEQEVLKEQQRNYDNGEWLKKNYPIGSQFWYMGTEFRVREFSPYVEKYCTASVGCDYRDNKGKFHYLRFDPEMLKAL